MDKRGGFCYELNGLFHALLKELGFSCSIISGRVYNNKTKKYGEEYDHLAILVDILDEKYLVDVGYGEFAFHPLELKSDRVQTDPRGTFIIEMDEEKYYKVSKFDKEEKIVEYLFTEKERAITEFKVMCEYCLLYTSPSPRDKRQSRMPSSA